MSSGKSWVVVVGDLFLYTLWDVSFKPFSIQKRKTLDF
jgi:hypothetical protein